jgi:hypothetical protein
MLKKTVKYTDYNGAEQEEEFYFNLSKSELVELQVSEQGGFEEFLKKIIAEQDNKQLVARFKEIILLSYGKRSDDGKRFIKSAELREEFSQTAAFDELFLELAGDAGAATQFITGIMPAGMVQQGQLSVVDTTPQPVQEERPTDKALSEMSDVEFKAEMQRRGLAQ